MADGEVIVGLRPEQLRIGAEGPCFEIVPSLVERLGSEQLVYVPLPDEHKISQAIARARVDEQADTFIGRFLNAPNIEVGKPLPISFDPADLRLFDPGTQLAL